MRDSLWDSVVVRPALPVALRTANTGVNGTSVDKSYQNNFFKVVLFSIHTGTLTDGTTTFTMEDSDNGSAWAAADASYVQGTLPVVAATDDDKTYQVGYVGPKRFVRLIATQASATSGGIMGATAILGAPRRYPVIP